MDSESMMKMHNTNSTLSQLTTENPTELGDCMNTYYSDYSDYFDNEEDCIQTLQEWTELETLQFVTWGVIATLLVALGLVGNILSLIVLSHPCMRSPTSIYLQALAVFDSLLLISAFLFMSLPTLNEAYTEVYGYVFPYAYPFMLISQTCSIYTTVGFTIDRYIAVCHSLKASRWCTQARTRKSLALITLCSVLYNVPRMFETKTIVHTSGENNASSVSWQYTRLGEYEPYRRVYLIGLHITVMIVLPFIVLLILNTILILNVRKSNHMTRHMRSVNRRTNNPTTMLIVVVTVFLVCQIPSILDNIYNALLSEADKHRSFPVKVHVISSLFVIMNSALNFYMYCMFGNKFRHAFLTIIFKCKWRHQQVPLRSATRTFSATQSDSIRSKLRDKVESMQPLNDVKRELQEEQ